MGEEVELKLGSAKEANKKKSKKGSLAKTITVITGVSRSSVIRRFRKTEMIRVAKNWDTRQRLLQFMMS